MSDKAEGSSGGADCYSGLRVWLELVVVLALETVTEMEPDTGLYGQGWTDFFLAPNVVPNAVKLLISNSAGDSSSRFPHLGFCIS
ncbi:hypothetical protein QE152_g27302 [Popillia japonica]|uniref:Uncharacterized protein n=1 Tax=Popillia japonica TaxID=7064 RepID=A0AAW1JUS1_POPJA